ncbi:hypothetical protein CO018_00115 [Candidatus Beckwithbacteria bacterium CG_4_9_14_0_2_um_filter_47_11]|uniref:Energy-coupling factor transporter transmembrane protein EcfT n=3 Tax=Candidatus Beckwithiibacteriota TaxID=1752726 RepID=A0A2M8G583_9BACT|nr:MAG: hypothetical protein CO018_00115 [Candidatus Beckwithbacteria bacterium CG_4_9_14_0_2_um_filter_47_11]
MKQYLKLIALIFSSALILRLEGPSLQAAVFGLLVLVLLALGQKIWSRLKFLIPPLILIAGLQVLFNRSLAGLTAGFKITNMSLIVLLYTGTTSPGEISRVFRFLPVGLALTLTIALNLIPIILQEAQKIRLVQISRGKRLPNPLPIIVPLLHRTLQRSQQLAIILETRKKAKT